MNTHSIRTSLLAFMSLLALPGFPVATVWAQVGTPSEQISVGAQGENQAIRLLVDSYELTASKLGDAAPQGKQFLVIRGTLTNRNSAKGVSVPPVDKAFPMRINGESMIELNPLSEDTADPFWGPLVLGAGEERPFEMIFAVPSEGLESAELRHLSNMGAMSIYVIGSGPEIATDFLAGPVSVGTAQMAVESLVIGSTLNGQPAPAGQQFLTIHYWFRNLLELHPLETNIASLTTLVEDGGYLYQPLSAPKAGEAVTIERYYAGEPTAGELNFLVPKSLGILELVHFTEAGPIRLDLMPERPDAQLPPVIAGPSRSGRIIVTIYQIRPSLDYGDLIFDLGLSLNVSSALADLPIDLSRAFELHETSGAFYKADPGVRGMRRPLGQVVLRRDQVTRGEIAFRGVSMAPGQTLLLPLSSGHVRVHLPHAGTQPHVAQTQPSPEPSRSGSGVSALLGAVSLQRGGDQPAGGGEEGPAEQTQDPPPVEEPWRQDVPGGDRPAGAEAYSEQPQDPPPLEQPTPGQPAPGGYGQYGDQPDPRIEQLLDEAMRLMRERKLMTPAGGSAVDRLDEVLGLDPYNPRAYQLLFDIYRTYVDWSMTAMRRSQYGQAARYVDSALDLLSRDMRSFVVSQEEVANLHFIQGEAMAAQGRTTLASNAYLRALALNPDLDEARMALDRLESAPPAQQAPVLPPPGPIQEETAPESPQSITGIPEVLDTGTLRINRIFVFLYGVKGVHGPYADELEAYIRDREVSCEKASEGSYRCLLGAADLSEVVLLNGAGKAKADAPEKLKSAEMQARENKVGLWQ